MYVKYKIIDQCDVFQVYGFQAKYAKQYSQWHWFGEFGNIKLARLFVKALKERDKTK